MSSTYRQFQGERRRRSDRLMGHNTHLPASFTDHNCTCNRTLGPQTLKSTIENFRDFCRRASLRISLSSTSLASPDRRRVAYRISHTQLIRRCFSSAQFHLVSRVIKSTAVAYFQSNGEAGIRDKDSAARLHHSDRPLLASARMQRLISGSRLNDAIGNLDALNRRR